MIDEGFFSNDWRLLSLSYRQYSKEVGTVDGTELVMRRHYDKLSNLKNHETNSTGNIWAKD